MTISLDLEQHNCKNPLLECTYFTPLMPLNDIWLFLICSIAVWLSILICLTAVLSDKFWLTAFGDTRVRLPNQDRCGTQQAYYVSSAKIATLKSGSLSGWTALQCMHSTALHSCCITVDMWSYRNDSNSVHYVKNYVVGTSYYRQLLTRLATTILHNSWESAAFLSNAWVGSQFGLWVPEFSDDIYLITGLR